MEVRDFVWTTSIDSLNNVTVEDKFKNSEEHLEHLGVVLVVLGESELYANRTKCQFLRRRIEYLGHIIFGEGVEVDPNKIWAVLEWPTPMCIKEVQSLRIIIEDLYRIRKYGCSTDATVKKGAY